MSSMPKTLLLNVLAQAGALSGERPPSADELREAEAALQAALDPETAAASLLRARRQVDEAKALAAGAASSAAKLGEILEGLLGSDRVLGRLDGLEVDGAGRRRAYCRVHGQHRELAVHPEVSIEELEELAPWEQVAIHPKEMLVVGAVRHQGLFRRAHGAVVEFRGYHDRDLGLVRALRQGHDEEIVALAPALRDRELSRPSRLVLFRDDESVAIAVLPADAPESRFEIDVARLEASLEDLVGMDAVIEPLIEDVLMCVVHPEIRRQFDLRPLRGLLLYSYKPGMGKTALMRALAVWLKDLGERLDFDVVLYSVKPNELKSIWHGGDAKLVREELCGAIAARQALPRTRPLFQIVVLDEIDALGKRAGGDDRSFVGSSAHNDAVQALLVEMDGLVAQLPAPDQAPAHVLWVGLTNRPDLLDDALKRPGRFGDLVLEVPAIQKEGAAGILEVYARGRGLPWWVDGEVTTELDEREIRERFLQPAVDHVFEAVVLRYHTDARRGIAVSAGEILSGVHYKEAMNLAKKRAAKRRLLEDGPPAIGVDDVTDSLLDQALAAARQMDADRQMLQRQLRLRVPVSGVELTARGELADHVYVLPAAAPAGAGSAGR